jgi:hypothetical protein
MDGRYRGYRNYTEWKQKDPDSYWKHIDGLMDKYEEDATVNVEKLAAKISSIPVYPDNKFSEQIGRAVRGELTQRELDICNGVPIGIEALEIPLRWYEKLWKWFKGLFAKKQESNPMSEPVRQKVVEDGVFINNDFDMADWVSEQNIKIDKAIRIHSEGKKDVEGEVVCPVCFKNRRYYVASNGHARTSCDGCNVSTLQ